MYKQETIKKVVLLAKQAEKQLTVNIDSVKISISNGNRKIGKVMNVSLMPVVTCHNCKECKKLCYDIKACLQYPATVINARIRNTILAKYDRDRFSMRSTGHVPAAVNTNISDGTSPGTS